MTRGISFAISLFLVLPALAQAEGKRFAILVGIKKYDHSALPPLEFTENDVSELADLLKPAGYEIILLTDSQGAKDRAFDPTRANIDKNIRAVLNRCKSDDMVIVAFAGHGLQFEGKSETYFCPKDARPFADQKSTLVDLEALYKQMGESGAGVKFLLVDACRDDPHSGRGRGVTATSTDRVPPKGLSVFFSCKEGERAFEHSRLKHGVFFHHVLEGLRGKAADADGEITIDTLVSNVRKQVPRQVPDLFKGAKQTPTLRSGEVSGTPAVLARVTAVKPNATVRIDPETEENAIKWVQQHYGRITRDPDQKDEPIVAIRLSCSQLRQADLKNLSAFPNLERLELSGLHLSGFNGQFLATLPALKTLKLTYVQITEAGVRDLSKAPLIKDIQIEDFKTPADAETIASLASLRALTSLSVGIASENRFPKIQAVAKLTQLSHLYLKSTYDFSDKELALLSQMEKLESLEVHVSDKNPGLSVAGLRQLKSLKNLKYLNLGIGIEKPAPAELVRAVSEFDHLEKMNLRVATAGAFIRARAETGWKAVQDTARLLGESLSDPAYEPRRKEYEAQLREAAKYDVIADIEAVKKSMTKCKLTVQYER